MNKNIIIAGLVVVIGLVSYLAFSQNGSPTNIVDATLKCNQPYELKKAKYWGEEIGQSKAIYNPKLNTCLALNIYNSSAKGEYFAMVMDMQNDKTLLYYSDKKEGFYVEDEQQIDCKNSYNFLEYGNTNEYGCEKYELLDKMFEQVKRFGFTVIGG